MNETCRVREVSSEDLELIIRDHGQPVPIEQTQLWATIERATPGREPWQALVIACGHHDVAAVALVRYEGRFLTQIAAKHGPVWLDGQKPSLETERMVAEAIAAHVRYADPKAAVLRLHLWNTWSGLRRPILKTIWDRTVILDILGTEDDMFARMSKSGRRFVRLALRNEEVTTADETDVDLETFSRDIFPVFAETGARQGFGIMSAQHYYTMLEKLRPDHARLITARLRGECVAWAIYTMCDGVGTYLYAASSAEARDSHAVFAMMWRGIRELNQRGVEKLDLYGASSERTPELKSLDQFKLKWSGGSMDDVAGAWDIALRSELLSAYDAAVFARSVPAKIKNLVAELRQKWADR